MYLETGLMRDLINRLYEQRRDSQNAINSTQPGKKLAHSDQTVAIKNAGAVPQMQTP
jgi:hypothetical protein